LVEVVEEGEGDYCLVELGGRRREGGGGGRREERKGEEEREGGEGREFVVGGTGGRVLGRSCRGG
jgi:hypothetical protein